jgi:hypothetical protein
MAVSNDFVDGSQDEFDAYSQGLLDTPVRDRAQRQTDSQSNHDHGHKVGHKDGHDHGHKDGRN